MAEQESFSTEQDIMAEIDAAEEGVTHVPYDGEVESAGTPPQQEAQPEQQPQPQDTATQRGSEGDAAPQGQQPQRDPNDFGNTRSDAKGNLVDQRTGEVVASAGTERRVFERARRVSEENTQLKQDLERHAQAIQQLQQQGTPGQQHGLSDAEMNVGVQIMQQFKSNPVSAARYVVEEAMRAGYNLEDIIGRDQATGASSLDMAALNKLLDQRLGPIDNIQQQREEQLQQQRLEQEANAEAEKQYYAFLDQHQHAAVHEDYIAQLMSRQNWSAEKAYYEVRDYARRNGLDFTQPLGPQVRALREQQNPTGQSETTRQQVQQPRPIPSGGAANMGMTPSNQHQTDASMSAESSFDDIVSQSLREAGMR